MGKTEQLRVLGTSCESESNKDDGDDEGIPLITEDEQ